MKVMRDFVFFWQNTWFLALFVCWCQRKTSSYLNSKQQKGWSHLDIILSLSLIHYIALTWCDVCIIKCQSFQHIYLGPLGRSKMDPKNTKPQRFADPNLWTQEFLLIEAPVFVGENIFGARMAQRWKRETGPFSNGVNGWDERSDVVWC